jgi:hypothetical protein
MSPGVQQKDMGHAQFAKGGQGGFLGLGVALNKTYPFGYGYAGLWTLFHMDDLFPYSSSRERSRE